SSCLSVLISCCTKSRLLWSKSSKSAILPLSPWISSYCGISSCTMCSSSSSSTMLLSASDNEEELSNENVLDELDLLEGINKLKSIGKKTSFGFEDLEPIGFWSSINSSDSLLPSSPLLISLLNF